MASIVMMAATLSSLCLEHRVSHAENEFLVCQCSLTGSCDMSWQTHLKTLSCGVSNNVYALLLQVAYARQLASECTIAQVTSKDAPLLHFCDLLLKACPLLFGPVPRRTCARNEKSDVQKTAHRQRDVLIALLRIMVLELMHLFAVIYCIQGCKH